MLHKNINFSRNNVKMFFNEIVTSFIIRGENFQNNTLLKSKDKGGGGVEQ